MLDAIKFWLTSYETRWFVRFTIIDKAASKAIGTVELFDRASEDAFNGDGVLRLDVGSTYEKESILYHIMSLVVPPAFELFDCDEIITKVPNYAVERIKAVQRFGFTKSEELLIGTHDGYAYNGYWKYRNKLHKSGGAFMDIVYRRLSDKELDTFIAMRINQLREEGAKEDMDLRPALKDYYQRHMADETFISWIALDNEKIIGTSGISIVEKPPYFGCPSGKIALLSSMFTDKSYRRQGIAKKLLSLVVDEARKQGCGTVQITASDMGVLLYTDFGFVKNNNFMQYKL